MYIPQSGGIGPSWYVQVGENYGMLEKSWNEASQRKAFVEPVSTYIYTHTNMGITNKKGTIGGPLGLNTCKYVQSRSCLQAGLWGTTRISKVISPLLNAEHQQKNRQVPRNPEEFLKREDQF